MLSQEMTIYIHLCMKTFLKAAVYIHLIEKQMKKRLVLWKVEKAACVHR